MEGILFTVLFAIYFVVVRKQLAQDQSLANEDTNAVVAEK